MKTHEFIKALRNSADKELIFANADGQSIHAGYHLTEIKAASFETVDCGGKTNRWNETILQLWVPEDAEDTYMKATNSCAYMTRCGVWFLSMKRLRSGLSTAMKISSPRRITSAIGVRTMQRFGFS